MRKNSIASSVGAPGVSSSMRPRANTISHIDGAALNSLMSSANPSIARHAGYPTGHGLHLGLSGIGNGDYRGMSTNFHHPNSIGLPKIDTHLGMNMGGGLRTAPVQAMGDGFNFDQLFGGGSTINPAQLHFADSVGDPMSPFQPFPPYGGGPMVEEDDAFDWMAGFDKNFMPNGNDEAIDKSSPSAISTGSQSGFSDVMVDGSNHIAVSTSAMWSNPLMASVLPGQAPFPVDTGSGLPDFMNPLNNMTINDMQRDQPNGDFNMSSPPSAAAMSPGIIMPGMPNPYFHPTMAFTSDSNSISSSSANGSARHSSVTSVSTESITDATRSSIILGLSQASGHGSGQRKYSQPAVSSPLSPNNTNKISNPTVSLPSTENLQRYVNAYLHFFHPHMPFIHIATLSFDSPALNNHGRGLTSVIGGGHCLILAMAAIGAMYEFEAEQGKELFEAAKKMILFYLEERRKAALSAVPNGALSGHDTAVQKTPLWLVQAMLLNLIYGHQCGDKQAAEVAYTHCAALVSLAKAAELDKVDNDAEGFGGDVNMTDDSHLDEHSQWIRWKTREERKRTLFAVFILSSLTVTALNHPPRILNSELHLNLPCEEDLWNADNAQVWSALGGVVAADHNAVTFADALTFLLTASQRQQPEFQNHSSYPQPFGSTLPLEELPESELKPSTFGCYVLINAIHVYIWETRQRHSGRQWKQHETESMHAQIEPALRAWQSAWKANPHHGLERPNPFGPLSADCIPLLDLAYVRLFVSLGRSKDAFWQRDFDAMAEEIARGVEIVQHAENSDNSSDPTDSTRTTNTSTNSPGVIASPQEVEPMSGAADGNMRDGAAGRSGTPGQSSKRERHLRKAAFYAADSLAMSDKLGVTFAEFTSRELPIQSAMCTFDCAQVLAEWVATIQERVGRYLGVLGKDDIDLTQVPAIMLLEEEDVKLLQKISDILNNADMKITFDIRNVQTPAAMSILGGLSNIGPCGYGSRLLMFTAYMLEKAAVWPSKYPHQDIAMSPLTLHSHPGHGSRPRNACKPHESPRRSFHHTARVIGQACSTYHTRAVHDTHPSSLSSRTPHHTSKPRFATCSRHNGYLVTTSGDTSSAPLHCLFDLCISCNGSSGSRT